MHTGTSNEISGSKFGYNIQAETTHVDDKHDEDGGPSETHASEFGVSCSDMSIRSWEKNHKRRKKANQLTRRAGADKRSRVIVN